MPFAIIQFMKAKQEKLQSAIKYAMENRPKIGGFPFLAECLRQAGVKHNVWSLPGAQSIYVFKDEAVVMQGNPLLTGLANIPPFNKDALVTALRTDQEGKSTFPEFLMNAWMAGVIKYDVDFDARIVTYYGAYGENYMESYAPVEIGTVSVESL
jgi:uncharacterized protein YbcV (DUF1398 family)